MKTKLHFLILPNQLYEKKYLRLYRNCHFILWEHDHYFKKYKYNKKKLVLHRASMKYYYDYLLQSRFRVTYIDNNTPYRLSGKYIMFDPIDLRLTGDIQFLESPNFLISCDQMKRYKQKYKNFRFSTFYKWHKKELDIIPEIKSQDKLNRKKLDISVPTLQSYSTKRFVEEAKEYVEKYFPKNYGTTENFIYPVTHKKAREMLLNFFSSKLEYFGDYQDAITKEDNYLFHSVLSSSINIGLLNPCEIIVKIPNFVRLNSLEGYIRQLFWREFQRYTYLNVDFENKNYFGNKKKLRKAWYEGTLGIDPVDDAIKDGFETGYLHHIRRLMVVGNYMNLSGIHPKEGFRWFMEFSVDSYEWVMHQNVLDMVFFVTDGKTSRKPYISSSNYIRRMSDYKKGQWSVTWDTMYRTFIQKHKNKLSRYHFRL